MQHKKGIIPGIASAPKAYSAWFVVIFLLTFGFLVAVDAIPEPTNANAEMVVEEEFVPEAVEVVETPEMPVKIVASAAMVDTSVSNPVSSEKYVLDNALTRGAVRDPRSAQLGVEGTVLIMGHSSNLPVIYNKAYKAFNNVGKLQYGDTISVYSATQEYRYSVTRVDLANAEEDVVELPDTGRYLVLVTCDTLTKKSSRFVVYADFVGAYARTSQ